MSHLHRIYLVPGFFGFANLGELVYFGHVRTFLEREFLRREIPVELHIVPSHPTASIRVRARDLLETIEQTARGDDGPIHLIGHSTGGLDARLLLSPGVTLGDGLDPTPWVGRVRSLVTLATPHHGTPLASLFSSMLGARMLGVLSLFTLVSLRYGRVPLSVSLKLASLLRRSRSNERMATLLDQLFTQLLGDFSQERRQALVAFFAQVSSDQSLVAQLALEAMDLFNAGTLDRPGVRYGCVITRAEPPSLRARMSIGVSPYGQGTYALYSFLHGRSSQFPESRRPRLPGEQAERFRLADGTTPSLRSSDGIVPSWSQIWGEVIALVKADHLDVIGHFDDPANRGQHMDWLLSGSGFSREDFETTWRKVTDFCLPPAITRDADGF